MASKKPIVVDERWLEMFNKNFQKICEPLLPTLQDVKAMRRKLNEAIDATKAEAKELTEIGRTDDTAAGE